MFLFTDVETTGLDPHKGLLLEVAIVVTDNDLAELATHVEVINQRDGLIVLRDCNLIDNYVEIMHTKNRLWNDCLDSTTSLPHAEHQLLRFVERYTEVKTVPMAGNTISFDRSWLKIHMPKLEAHYSHHNVDMSTLTELFKRWRPDVYESRPGGKQTDKATHRALADVRNSIALARHYKPYFTDAVLP